MICTDTWLRRHALQLSGQLPDNYADGLEVLRHMRLIWDHLHQGDDGGERVATVLTIVTKPPQGVA
jgi:hypothetical protein